MKIDGSHLLLIMLAVLSLFLFDSLNEANSKVKRLTDETITNQLILSTVLELSVMFNEISQNNLRERDRATVASEKVKTIIKTILVDNGCAPLDAPGDATIELHKHAERIRSNATSAHSSTLTQ